MNLKTVIFKMAAVGYHTHHWITRQQKKYLSLQTANNQMQMLEFDATSKSFVEDGSMPMVDAAVPAGRG